MAFEVSRLLREKWTSANLLAQEVYAVLRGFKTDGIDGTLKITPKADSPAIVINWPEGSTAQPFQIQIGDRTYAVPAMDVTGFTPRLPDSPDGFSPNPYQGSSHDPGPVFAPSLPAYLSTPVDAPVWPDGSEAGSPIPTNGRVTGVELPVAVPFTTLGQVVSGSGATYVVDVWLNGLSGAASLRLTATVPQIDAAETVPVGTWVYVTCTYAASGAIVTAYFQPPVWLE